MLNEDQQEKIVNHYAKNFGIKRKKLLYFPEKANGGRKIDLLWSKPTKKHPFNTLATMGLSDLIIRGGSHEYTELIMMLPADWNPSVQEMENTWQAKFLKQIAHCIQDQSIPVEYGLIFIDKEGEPISPDCNMYAGLVVFPEVYHPRIFKLKNQGKEISFFALTTLTKDELEKARSKDVFDFIEEDLSTENGTDVFVYNNRNTKKTASEKLIENNEKKTNNVVEKGTGKTKKVVIKKK